MKGRWLSSLGLAVGLATTGARAADEVVWRAVAAERPEPAVTLGAPIALAAPLASPPAPSVTRVSWAASAALPPLVVRAQADGMPPPAPPPGATAPPVGPPPLPPPGIPNNPGPGELYNNGVAPDGGPGAAAPGTGFWDKTKQIFDLQTGPFCGNGIRKPLQSDHAFDGFISPMTNPFLFEDPRALTELRPIFLYQTIPNKNPGFRGGDIEFAGVQGRLALTDQWSIVINKLGGIWINPNGGAVSPYNGDRSGFAEINLGPKWTFLRNEQSGTLGALGVTFEIPTGSKEVFQDTGTLSLVPYVVMGQNFFRSSYGSFNVLGEIGYNFGVDSSRSDYFFTSLHLDYDVANLHKIYPLLELNWQYYTKNGKEQDQDFEGGDLINFGATDVTGHNNVTLAVGVRYKFNESFQAGGALEFPVSGESSGVEDFRLTLDFIVRVSTGAACLTPPVRCLSLTTIGSTCAATLMCTPHEYLDGSCADACAPAAPPARRLAADGGTAAAGAGPDRRGGCPLLPLLGGAHLPAEYAGRSRSEPRLPGRASGGRRPAARPRGGTFRPAVWFAGRHRAGRSAQSD